MAFKIYLKISHPTSVHCLFGIGAFGLSVWEDDGETIGKMECCANGAKAVETKELNVNTNRDAVNDVFQDKYRRHSKWFIAIARALVRSLFYYSSHSCYVYRSVGQLDSKWITHTAKSISFRNRNDKETIEIRAIMTNVSASQCATIIL